MLLFYYKRGVKLKADILRRISAAALAAAMLFSFSESAFFDMHASAEGGEIMLLNAAGGEAVSDKLNDALLDAALRADDDNPITVKLPAGVYILDSALHIYSNTILDATGCTLISDDTKHNLFILGTNGSFNGIEKYNSSEHSSGYSSVRNVTVRGGVWVGNDKNTNTPIRLAHATNVTFEGMTVRGANMSTHQVEAAGIDGFYVRGCTFCDFTPRTYKGGHFEAIQLDTPINNAIYNSSYLDGTTNRNVEITGCTFSNVSRGVGTHSMLVGAYHSNIKITSNTFINIQEEAIVALNYVNCLISNNTIINAGGGILFESAKYLPSSGNKISSMHTTVFDGQQDYGKDFVNSTHSVISSNNITTCYTPYCSRIIGIRVHGLDLGEGYVGGDDQPLPAMNYYISDVTVSSNQINTAGGGILFDDARDCSCFSNSVLQLKPDAADERRDSYDGIYITSSCKGLSVIGNKVIGSTRYGIFINKSAVNDLMGNNVSFTGKNAVLLNSGTSVLHSIENNYVSDCGANAIVLSSSSSAPEISSNKIDTCSGSGIYLTSSSKVNGGINNNNISDCKSSAVYLKGSSAKAVSGNSLSGSGVNGIYLNDKAAVTEIINGNKISKCGANGIALNKSSKAKTINDNTVTESTSNGVYLTGSSSVSGSISKNIVKSSGANGIYLSAASAESIQSNTVTKAGKSGILVNSGSTVSGKISANTVSSPGQNGIALVKKSKAGSISSNKISAAAQNGIFVYNSSSVSGGISKNTVSSPKSSGILIDKKSKAAAVTSNKISKSGRNGIYLFNGSTVSGEIKQNSISAPKENAIVLNLSSKAKAITSNKVSNSGKNGIYLYDASTVTGEINKNIVKSSKLNGIVLSLKSKAKALTSNSISNSGSNGIYILDRSSVSGNVKGNTINSSKLCAVILAEKASLGGSITGNKINTAKTGISKDRSSKIKGKVKSNTLSKISGKKTVI